MSIAGAVPAFNHQEQWRLVSGVVPHCPLGTLVTFSMHGDLLDVTRAYAGLLASIDLRSATVALSPDGGQCLVRSIAGDAVFARVAAAWPVTGLPPDLGLPNQLQYREGTWASAGYRSGKTRARWTEIFFVLAALACFWLLLVSVQTAGIAIRANAGTLPTRAALDAVNLSVHDALGFLGLAGIGLAIAFLAWLSRTVDVVPALAGGTPRESPKSSVGWWFVPIVDFWKPYSILRELWDRLSVPSRPAGGLVVGTWWLTLIGAFLVDKVAAFSVSEVPSPVPWSTLQIVDLVEVGVTASYLIAAIVGLLMVHEIQGRADFRAHALELDGKPVTLPFTAGSSWAPGWPGAQAQAVAAPGPVAAPAVGAVPAPAVVPGPSTGDALRSLTELHAQGLVTDDEYAAKRTEILGRL